MKCLDWCMSPGKSWLVSKQAVVGKVYVFLRMFRAYCFFNCSMFFMGSQGMPILMQFYSDQRIFFLGASLMLGRLTMKLFLLHCHFGIKIAIFKEEGIIKRVKVNMMLFRK